MKCTHVAEGVCRRAQTRPWLEKVHRGVCREFEGKKGILRGNQGKRRSEKGGSRPFLLISVPLEGLRSRASCSPHFSPGGCCFTLFDFFKIYPCRFLAKSLSGRNLRPGNNTAERVCKRGARGMQGSRRRWAREEAEDSNSKGAYMHSRHVCRLLLYLTDCFHLLLEHFLYDYPPPFTLRAPRKLQRGHFGPARALYLFFGAYSLKIVVSQDFMES